MFLKSTLKELVFFFFLLTVVWTLTPLNAHPLPDESTTVNHPQLSDLTTIIPPAVLAHEVNAFVAPSSKSSLSSQEDEQARIKRKIPTPKKKRAPIPAFMG